MARSVTWRQIIRSSMPAKAFCELSSYFWRVSLWLITMEEQIDSAAGSAAQLIRYRVGQIL